MVGYLIWDTVVLANPGCLGADLDQGAARSDDCKRREKAYTIMESFDVLFTLLTA